MTLPAVEEGKTNRAAASFLETGGKGLNVSLVLNELGDENTAGGFTAGFTGCELVRRLKESHVRTDFVDLAQGYSRINVKIKAEQETEINTAGPEVSQADLVKLKEKLDALKREDYLMVGGSLPAGMTTADFISLIDVQARLICDVSGESLSAVLSLKPLLVKPNLDELSDYAGKKLKTYQDVERAAGSLRKNGAGSVAVSLGKDGALYFFADMVYYVKPKPVAVVDTVGAGDSMVAGFLHGLTGGDEPLARLKTATACSLATITGHGLAKREDILQFDNDDSFLVVTCFPYWQSPAGFDCF